MRATVLKGAIWGAAFGIALVVGVVIWTVLTTSWDRGEAMYVAVFFANLAGTPTTWALSFALLLFREVPDWATTLYGVTVPVIYAVAVVVNWAWIGALVGFAVGAIRRVARSMA